MTYAVSNGHVTEHGALVVTSSNLLWD